MALLAVLVLGIAGTLVDLLLLSHYEDAYQQIPVVLLGASLLVAAWHAVRPNPATVRTLRGLMILIMAAGAAGVAFHVNGAAEFQFEIDPSISRRELFRKVIRVHAPPLLAPAPAVEDEGAVREGDRKVRRGEGSRAPLAICRDLGVP